MRKMIIITDLFEYLRDDSHRPFVLYWLALAIALIDVITHWRWDSMFEPYTKGIPMGGGVAGGHIFISYEMQFFLSVVFVICMLKWPDLGIGFAALYIIFLKLLLYFSIAGLLIGIKSIDKSVQLPAYLILWEVTAFSLLIAYMVKKEIVIRTSKITELVCRWSTQSRTALKDVFLL